MKLLQLLKQQHKFAQKYLENVATTSSNSILPKPSVTISQPNTSKSKGITILLMHTCEPRNNFYAKTYLNQLLQRHLHLPKLLSSPLTEFYFKFAILPKQCVKNSINYPFYPEAIDEFSFRLECSVSQLLPEFGSIRCLPASDHGEPNVECQLQRIFSENFDHLILLPISPLLQPGRIEAEISAIHKKIRAQTNPVQIDEDEELEPEGEPIPEYVPRNAPQNKFSLLVIDQVHSSECIVQYWASRLVPLLDKYEVIVFTSSYPLFSFNQCRIDLKEISRRIMYAAYKDSPKSTPWRICFYSGWELPNGLGNLMNKMSIQRNLGKLKSGGRKGPVLVVPLDSLFRNFNTETALPRAIGNLADTDGFVVNILQPESDDNALVYSLAELIKIVMLNRRKFAR